MLAGHSGKYSRYEIERKFLLKELPENLPEQYIEIEDTYPPNSSLRLRIQKSPEGAIKRRKLTKKEKDPNRGATTCIITSLYLSENDLKALGNLKGHKLHKKRYACEDGITRITFDVFKGPLDGLILAEVEFTDESACLSFKPSDSTWQDVTHDPHYSGGHLAYSGSIPV